ncbi:MAG: hypothetical protein J7K54_05110 [Candidatus Aenigmarchaeota archaeon]|nr:hypothetical protein [Candidatus Aenigmarchaeota archaeon]
MILIVDMNSQPLGTEEFARPLMDIAGRFGDARKIHYTKVRKSDIEEAEKIILSGTPLREFGYLGDIDTFSWLKETSKPVLGICAGMQVMAAVFGSALGDEKSVGFADVEVVRKNPLLEGRMKVYELHGKAVKASAQFEVLAKSGKCIQAIRHKSKPFYGILFHPEARNRDVVERFLKAI